MKNVSVLGATGLEDVSPLIKYKSGPLAPPHNDLNDFEPSQRSLFGTVMLPEGIYSLLLRHERH